MGFSLYCPSSLDLLHFVVRERRGATAEPSRSHRGAVAENALAPRPMAQARPKPRAQALQGWEAELGSTMAKAGEWATNLSPELKGASGAMSQSLDKAWQQWKKKVRKSLKNQRHQQWAASRAAHASLMRLGMPQDRWANWHVLAAPQGGHDAWKKAWLRAAEDPAARLWILHSED